MWRECENLCMKWGGKLEANSLQLCKGVFSCTGGGWVTSLVSPLGGIQQNFRAMALIWTSYFSSYKQRNRKQGEGVGHLKSPVSFFSVLGSIWLSSKGPRVSPTSLVCGWAASCYLIENWSYILSVGKSPPIYGVVGFESDLKGRVQLLVADPKASVGFDQAGWAAGQRTGWG